MQPPDYSIPPDLIHGNDYFVNVPSLWHLPLDTWKEVWKVATGKGIVVAVLDTGYSKHEFGPTPLATKSFISGQSTEDGHGHGTHCCGTSIGRGDVDAVNYKGEAIKVGIGVAPEASLIIGKVLSNSGSGGSPGIAAGIRWAADQGANVISMSLGGGSSDSATNQAIDYAFSKGCLVNVAAGNSGYNGSNTIGWPGRYEGCCCTGAYDSSGAIASFSSGGPQIDWACPGVSIISFSNRGSGYTTMSGTSMATPYGAGVLALIYELLKRKGWSVWDSIDQLKTFFKANMKDAGAPGFDNRFGMGIPISQEIVKTLLNEEVSFA